MVSTVLLCLVIAIADGDTLTARCEVHDEAQNIVVRLSQIDAPERGQPWGDGPARWYMVGPDRLSPDIRAETLTAFRETAETRQLLARAAEAKGRAEEWASLTARLAVLRGRLMAGEGGHDLATAAEVFADDF